MTAIHRRHVLKAAGALVAGSVVPCEMFAQAESTAGAVFENELAILRDMDDSSYRNLWSNLRYVTEAELDWRPHPEANTLRWVVGHLNWFEEWVADAIAGTGLYLQEKGGPTSFQERPLKAMKERFDAARDRYLEKMRSLQPGDMTRSIRYVYNEERDSRSEVSLRSLLRTHTTHLAGHRYQVRYIRGTYSRAHKTDKARFDPW